ncbi:DNA damage-inducible transcript 3 protein [Emydura macquarii macquarii]|uniref:DNA damage-inducible transcript 3 protein n=1 Tax=Emydura macquarii macquarii TaxID=1129001 RepID=UPI00352AEE57
MAAEPVPTSLLSWELEAWYEDLQEVLSSDENGGPCLAPGAVEQKELASLDATVQLWGADTPAPLLQPTAAGPGSCELDAELLELLAGLPESDSSQSSSAQTCTEDEEVAGPARGVKRKRSSQPTGQGKKRSREKEQNERRVTELTAENERLKGQIERLSAEVEATRAALINRMVTLQQT